MDVVPINPIRASNKIVNVMAATVIGIKYGELSNRRTIIYVIPNSTKNINEIRVITTYLM